MADATKTIRDRETIVREGNKLGGIIMFFEFFKKFKTKTLLFAAGFLVLAGLISLSLWFYFSFLKSDGLFLEVVPAKSSVYWQSDFSRGADDVWLWATTRAILPGEAANQARFLEESIAPEASKIGFAILPDSTDFIFFAKIDAGEFNLQKSKLEELNYHYIFEENNRLIISNSRSGLEAAVAVLSQEEKSFADDKMKLISFNGAKRHSSAQIYFEKNFKVDTFLPLPWSSDFWSSNKLIIAMKRGVKDEYNIADFYFLAVSDDKYLKNNMENVLKDDLAVLLPEIREKILPDNTVVKELLANPDAFKFQEKKIGGFPASYLPVPALNQEFFLGKERQKTIFGNSEEMILDFWANSGHKPDYYGKNLIEALLDGLKWLTADFGGVIFEVNASNVQNKGD